MSAISNLANDKLVTKDYVFLCLANFLMILAQRMTNGILSLYTDSLGASGTLTGLLSSAFTITSLLLIPFSGQIVNHFSKRVITAIGLGVISISTFGFSISNSVSLLLFFRLLQGIGLAFTGISCLTLLSLIVSSNKLVQGIAYYSITTAIAQAIGPELGLRLGDVAGYTKAFKIEAILIALSAICILLIQKDDKKTYSFKYSYNNIIAKQALIPAILVMLVTGANFTITSFITLFANTINVTNIGKYFIVNAISLAIIRPIADNISKTISSTIMLFASLICLITSLVLLGIAINMTLILIASVINAIGYGISLPIIEALCLRSVNKDEEALASATNNIGSNLGILLGPIIAGFIKDLFNYKVMFISVSSFVAMAIIIVIINIKKINSINLKEEL